MEVNVNKTSVHEMLQSGLSPMELKNSIYPGHTMLTQDSVPLSVKQVTTGILQTVPKQASDTSSQLPDKPVKQLVVITIPIRTPPDRLLVRQFLLDTIPFP